MIIPVEIGDEGVPTPRNSIVSFCATPGPDGHCHKEKATSAMHVSEKRRFSKVRIF
jgi:hypothetical protein